MANLAEILAASIWDVRIGVAVAIIYGLSPFIALGIASAASITAVIPSLIVLRQLLIIGGRYFPRGVNFVFRMTRRYRPFIEKYGYVGIMLSVAIPLPGTGPWVGAITATLLEMDFVKASMALATGIILAALASMGITEGITSLIPFFSQSG